MRFSLFSHYKNLVHFLFHRFEGSNYEKMRFYLSNILVMDVSKFIDLKEKKVLDIGGSNGEFCAFLEKNFKCKCVNLEPYPPKKIVCKEAVKAFADKIPFKSNTFDFVICRGVMEHIPREKRLKSAQESYRVLKKGGVAYFVIPPWFNPHAGHMMKPFHILPFAWAKFLRKLFFGTKINGNSYEEMTLYPLTFFESKKIFSQAGFKTVRTLDTHLRLHFLTRIPIINEFLVAAVAFILIKE